MGHGVPELVLEVNERTWTLDASKSYSLGRDPQADVVFDDGRVSWRHATIRSGDRGWVIEDLGSTNGTFVEGQRVQQTEVGPGSAVHLGNATDGPRLSFTAAVQAAAQAAAPAAASVQAAAPAAAGVSAAPIPQYQPPQPQPQMYAGQAAPQSVPQAAPQTAPYIAPQPL